MKLDFIIIGTEKSGTTWLANMLRQHPDIFIPKEKELHYFNSKYGADPSIKNINQKRGVQRYENFFKKAKENQIKGEATPAYLWDKKAAQNIYRYNPNIKLITIFRNPIEKIYSFYQYSIQKGITSSPNILEEIEKNPYLIKHSLYSEQITRYYDNFPKENILIMFYDDLKKDNRQFLKTIENFIGVKEFFPKNIDQKSNTTGIPKYFYIKRFLYKLKTFFIKHNFILPLDISRKTGLSKIISKIDKAKKKGSPKKITKKEKEIIYNFVKEDIEKLEGLLSKDLSHRK